MRTSFVLIKTKEMATVERSFNEVHLWKQTCDWIQCKHCNVYGIFITLFHYTELGKHKKYHNKFNLILDIFAALHPGEVQTKHYIFVCTLEFCNGYS